MFGTGSPRETAAFSRRSLLAGSLAAATAVTANAAPRPSGNWVDQRLKSLGIDLPPLPKAIGSYMPYRVDKGIVALAGQIPMAGGKLIATGAVPTDVSIEQARLAARQCAINLLAALREACGGDLRRVQSCMRVTGYVACTPTFTDHPKVVDGASDLFVAIFGEAGRHARSSVGASSLPRGAPVEVEAWFAIRR